MNYFAFFDIPESFFPDEALLRKKFMENNRRWHPDFHTLGTPEAQAEALRMSTLNNEAYRTLSDPDKRMKYILESNGVLEAGGQHGIPPSFLIEMMDFNESVMELEFDFDEQRLVSITTELKEKEDQLLAAVLPVMEAWQPGGDLTPIKEYYLKNRYLLRIRENVSKFASR